MPKKLGGPRRLGVDTVWSTLDDLQVWACEAELYYLTPFSDRSELLASYPNWRAEYLEHKRQ